MANSRNSPRSSEASAVAGAIERALGDLLARVFVGAAETAAVPAFAIALSGGLDSMVLLHAAARFAGARGQRLFAFHVHHGLSPNAGQWEEFCRAQARSLGVDFDSRHVQLDRHDARGIEEAARVARYGALGELCRAHGVPLLLAAHHRDDQAETVLLQLMRGAGVAGLSGMAVLQQEHALLGQGVLLGRPLLGLSRASLELLALASGQQYVTDESNQDRRYRRNALRHEIMPVIDSHFPGFAELVARTALHAQSSQALLHELALIDRAACLPADGGAGQPGLLVSGLAALSPERADNLLRDWLHGQGVAVPSTARLAEIRSQMLGADADTQPFFDFASQTLHRIGGQLELHPRLGTPLEDALLLVWTGEPFIEVPAWHGRLVFETVDGPGLSAARLRDGPLELRPREGQERLKLAANRPSKSLKGLFQEAGVASWKRKWSPVLYLADAVVLVAGLGMDVRAFSDGPAIALRWESF